MKAKNNPNHLAIIMDGNGRWAKAKCLPIAEGHKRGAKKIRELLPGFLQLGIKHLTLFAFSTENWQRGQEEVSSLMGLLEYCLDNFIDDLQKNNCAVRIIGDLDKLGEALKNKIRNVEHLTKNNNGMTVYVAFSYSGRSEILHAARALAGSGAEFNEENFKSALYAPDMPDIDLLIRTSGRMRISNFALWQLAYSEIIFSPVLWPDFSKEDLLNAVGQYKKQVRTLGRR